jgi:hypothetical protein
MALSPILSQPDSISSHRPRSPSSSPTPVKLATQTDVRMYDYQLGGEQIMDMNVPDNPDMDMETTEGGNDLEQLSDELEGFDWNNEVHAFHFVCLF